MATLVDSEKLKYPQIKQIHKSSLLYENYFHKPCIVQEKLDGCNFRIIYMNEEISFGSRTSILNNGSFCNFGSIKENLLENVDELRKILQLDTFMIVGELIGYNKGKLLIPRIKYFEEKVVKFYAIEILDINKNIYLDFIRVQELLKTAGFNVIPYEESTIGNLTFKSTLFPDIKFIEGYVLHFGKERFKIKSEEFLKIENSGQPLPSSKNKNSVMNFIHNSAFFDFVSKNTVDDDAQKFHKDLCGEIIDNYLTYSDQDSAEEGEQLKYKEAKKAEIKRKANEIFSRTYGLILSNKDSIDGFDRIFKNYDIKRAKGEFVDYVLTI